RRPLSEMVTSVEDFSKDGPSEFGLAQNYPNPFNPNTTINYQLPKSGQVTIKVYDVLGNEVKTLVNAYKSAGDYSVNFDGSKLSSGMYMYRITAGGYTAARKMTLIK
ncbi:MAG: T9SS type A sorting domain-containing protein, partial [Bacteroidota bacterium]|nr:T9SS type A sorting domain-containing protein [Bacteroidota bacterium]